MNPETKSKEYHLMDREPMWNISGLTCQYIARKSVISEKFIGLAQKEKFQEYPFEPASYLYKNIAVRSSRTDCKGIKILKNKHAAALRIPKIPDDSPYPGREDRTDGGHCGTAGRSCPDCRIRM